MLLTSKKKQFLIGHWFGSICAEFTFSQFRLGWANFGYGYKEGIKTLQIHLLFTDVIITLQKVDEKGRKHLRELLK